MPLAVETGGPLFRLIKIQSWARGEREVSEPRGNICLLMTPVLHTVSLSNEAVGLSTLSVVGLSTLSAFEFKRADSS